MLRLKYNLIAILHDGGHFNRVFAMPRGARNWIIYPNRKINFHRRSKRCPPKNRQKSKIDKIFFIRINDLS